MRFNTWLVGWLQFDTAGDVQRGAVLQAVGDGGVNSRLVLGPH